jgi:hypothetical protein
VSNKIHLTIIRFDRKLIGPAKSHSCERKAAMNSMERVWIRMKVIASKSADQKALISMRESRNVVLRLCRQERLDTPPRDALHFLAKELVRLTLESQVPT